MTTQQKQGRLTPRTATTEKQLVALARDNVSTAGFWMLVHEDEVTVAKQRTGESASAMFSIPKRDFDRFVDWYNTGTWGRSARSPRSRPKAAAKRAPKKS